MPRRGSQRRRSNIGRNQVTDHRDIPAISTCTAVLALRLDKCRPAASVTVPPRAPNACNGAPEAAGRCARAPHVDSSAQRRSVRATSWHFVPGGVRRTPHPARPPPTIEGDAGCDPNGSASPRRSAAPTSPPHEPVGISAARAGNARVRYRDGTERSEKALRYFRDGRTGVRGSPTRRPALPSTRHLTIRAVERMGRRLPARPRAPAAWRRGHSP